MIRAPQRADVLQFMCIDVSSMIAVFFIPSLIRFGLIKRQRNCLELATNLINLISVVNIEYYCFSEL